MEDRANKPEAILARRAAAAERRAAAAERRAVQAEARASHAEGSDVLAQEQMRLLDERAARLEKWRLALEGRLVAQRRQFEILDSRYAALDQRKAAMEGSLSWRVTKPLRALQRKVEPPTVAEPEPIDPPPLGDPPAEFDAALYLELNPDIHAAGANPTEHFLAYGQYEGRPWRRPGLDVHPGVGIDPAKKTILTVLHTAERSGATLASLQRVQSLAARYNIVVWLLGDGALRPDFQRWAAEVILEPSARHNYVHAQERFDKIHARQPLVFAIVQGLESKTVLPALALHHVPIVSVLHDIASYAVSPFEFQEVFFWSDKTVFTDPLALEHALHAWPRLNRKVVTLLRPGVNIGQAAQAEPSPACQALQQDLSDWLQAADATQKLPLVLGAGPLDYAAGVDLFLACAARIAESPSGERIRFAWIGRAQGSAAESSYPVYLADQIKRSGLEGQVRLIDDTDDIDAALPLADAFLAPARYDPAAYPALQAMHHGVPVVCFDKSGGLADALAGQGLSADCLAKYMDVVDASDKILALLQSVPARKRVGEQCRALAQSMPTPESHAGQIEALGLDAAAQAAQEQLDEQEILASGMFQPDYFEHLGQQSGLDIPAVTKYIRYARSGLGARKPCPGFHPGIYKGSDKGSDPIGSDPTNPAGSDPVRGLTPAPPDPFADFLRKGRPQGIWTSPVVVGSPSQTIADVPPDTRVALHMHVFYPELLEDILGRLRLNRTRPELFISVKDTEVQARVREILADYTGQVRQIQVVPNRGRDIGPFLTAFGKELSQGYDLIGHLHTKQSFHSSHRAAVEAWRNFLMESLVGGEKGGAMADSILAAMSRDPSIGIVFPDDPNLLDWGENLEFAQALAPGLGLASLPEQINFPAGTMFWVRAQVLERFVSLGLDWEDYPAEPLGPDGSALHAMERLFGVVPTAMGLQCAVACVPGLTR